MSSLLAKDTNLSFPANIVVSASAGSGKTYTLTQRYVQFLLSERIPNHDLRNILAITFTNLAAKEMRQKILNYLKELSLGSEEKLDAMTQLVSLDKMTVRRKASSLVEDILSHYSDFQVKTIDSFMVSVFKATALELGFTPDLDILLTNDTLIDEAFEEYSLELSRHPGRIQILDDLVDLLSQTREGNKRFLWDPYTNMGDAVKRIYQMVAAHARPPVSGDLRAELLTVQDQIRQRADTLSGLLRKAGVPVNHHFQKDLDDIKEGNIEQVVDRSIKEKIHNKLSSAEKLSYQKLEGEIASIFTGYNQLIGKCRILRAQMHFQPYLKAIAEIAGVLTRLKRQRGQLFIHDVNKMLVDMIVEERIPDIYFQLGERIYHFLIDEFQDTSPIQWTNLRPLIENSLAQGGSSLFVVGDTKQSIYSFRFADWTIMKRMMEENNFPSAKHEVQRLDTNWRSFERILDFNREVFQKKIPATEYAEAGTLSGLNASAQKVHKGHERKGYAEVALFQKDEEQFPERVKLLDVIADCLGRGHRLRDIALLTPRNSDVICVSGWLNSAGIRFISHSSLDIRTRKITSEMIALLQFLDSPIDDLSFASFLMSDLLQSVLNHGAVPVAREEFQSLIFNARREGRSPLYKVFQEKYGEIWDHYFADLYGTVGYLPLYDLISEVYKVFEVFDVNPENEGTLVKLLEVVKVFEESGNNSIKEFLTFALDEADSAGWEMDVPADDDAVTLMTVHKAKGLDFPVVVVLLYDSSRKKKEYYVDEAEDGIRLLHISKKSTEKVAYLETIYNWERLKDDVDELNKLYVALTRAKEEMYVLGVYDEERGEPTRFLPDQEFPSVSKPEVVKKPIEPKRTLSTHHHNKRRIYETKAGGRLGRIETKRGELIHTVLYAIEFVDQDLAAQLNVAMGKLMPLLDSHFTPSEITSTVKAFLSDQSVKKLFTSSPKRVVFREKDFANASGPVYRMDRVVVDPDAVNVIDFKTGGDELEEEYRGQVRNYMALLRQLYPGRNVRGVIAYVDKCEIREVK